MDVADAVPVAEVRGHRDVGPVLGDRLEPRARIPEVWREERELRARVERPEREADETHVVVERQPAHQPVGRRHRHRLDHHPDGRQHVLVAEHDAARRGGAAGGVLEEADVVLGGADRRGNRGPRLEDVGGQEMPNVRRLGERGLDVGAEPVDGDDGAGLTAPEDPGLQLGIERRVEGHRHGADREGAEEGEEELLARREDDGHLVAGSEAPLPERSGVAEARRVEPPGGQRSAEEREVESLRLGLGPLLDEDRQGRRLGWPPRRRRCRSEPCGSRQCEANLITGDARPGRRRRLSAPQAAPHLATRVTT